MPPVSVIRLPPSNGSEQKAVGYIEEEANSEEHLQYNHWKPREIEPLVCLLHS